MQLPDGASKQRTDTVLSKIESYFWPIRRFIQRMRFRANFVFSTRGPNAATMFVPLRHWDERTAPQQHVKSLIGAAYGEFAKIPEALILAFNAPSIRGLGATGGFSIQLQDPSGGDFNKFSAVAQEFVAKARQNPAIGAIGTSFRVSAPRIFAKRKPRARQSVGRPFRRSLIRCKPISATYTSTTSSSSVASFGCRQRLRRNIAQHRTISPKFMCGPLVRRANHDSLWIRS